MAKREEVQVLEIALKQAYDLLNKVVEVTKASGLSLPKPLVNDIKKILPERYPNSFARKAR